MTCCTYHRPHRHYAEWIRETTVREECKCGKHPRIWTVADLMRAFRAGRR